MTVLTTIQPVAQVVIIKTMVIKFFSAVARTSDGGAVTSINGVYSWNWSWISKDTSIAGVRMAEKTCGYGFVSSASGSSGK
jgi:hypothetical protein